MFTPCRVTFFSISVSSYLRREAGQLWPPAFPSFVVGHFKHPPAELTVGIALLLQEQLSRGLGGADALPGQAALQWEPAAALPCFPL